MIATNTSKSVMNLILSVFDGRIKIIGSLAVCIPHSRRASFLYMRFLEKRETEKRLEIRVYKVISFDYKDG